MFKCTTDWLRLLCDKYSHLSYCYSASLYRSHVCVCICKSWLVTARWGVGVKQEVDGGFGGGGQMCGGSHTLIFRDCGRAVSCCSCNKRSVLESNQCAAILAYWLAHSCSCWRFTALLHLTHLAARTAIAPDYVQWLITASAIILLWKKKCC